MIDLLTHQETVNYIRHLQERKEALRLQVETLQRESDARRDTLFEVREQQRADWIRAGNAEAQVETLTRERDEARNQLAVMSSTLTFPTLDELLEALKAVPVGMIRCVGYIDARGDFQNLTHADFVTLSADLAASSSRELALRSALERIIDVVTRSEEGHVTREALCRPRLP